MTFRTPAVAFLLLATTTARAADPYAVKVVADSAAPTELAEPVRKQLAARCVQLVNARGELLAELWLRSSVPVKATDEQIKNGLTYREVPPTTLVGAVRFGREFSDYRKQKIMPGVYTLRLAHQPMDGDHQGTAPHSEFLLLCPAAEDANAATMEVKALHELSAKTTNSHPGVLLLFPGKGASEEPKLVNKGSGHWAVLLLLDVQAGMKKARLPMALNLVGASSAA
jgi:hypothetical protein